jgi:ABC-type nickel/cobalt efflux system permease component RcnA
VKASGTVVGLDNFTQKSKTKRAQKRLDAAAYFCLFVIVARISFEHSHTKSVTHSHSHIKSIRENNLQKKRDEKIISIFLPGGGCRELFGVKDANDSSSSFPLGVKHFHE